MIERSAVQQAQSSKWLLLAQLFVILPLLSILPAWTVAVWAVMAFWYWKIIAAGWRFPHPLIKAALALLSMIGLYLQYRNLFAVEPMVAMLVLAVVLKLLELKTARDHWLILLLCYFILACGFLFDQGIAAVLLAMVQITVILAAQQTLYRGRSDAVPMFKLSSLMLLQALPTMLFLFLVFPRIGPLWSMPLPSQQGRTGMSDSLEFGDIAKLSQSGELAFRASFEGADMPPTAELYWRGLVLESFDGRRWSRDKWSAWRSTAEPPTMSSAGVRYTVTLESDIHEWLYTLAPARVERSDVRYGGAYQWVTKKPVLGRMLYRAASQPGALRMEGERAQLDRNLRLPGNTNPRARALALDWQTQYPEPARRLAAALDFYRSSRFSYTLTPPLLGENNVDEFLFQSQQGFCEHFAGSFVFLMRAAGVPARVVIGYQGGEYNSDQNYLLVHQSDSHAWAEVWLDGEGWVRVDPTATVSPDRVRRGADAVLREQQGFLGGSPLSLRRFAWATKLRMFVDNINYAWARWVVNYDTESQYRVLLGMLGKIDMQRILLAMAGFVALPLAVVALWAIRPSLRSASSPADRYYFRACQRLARRYGVQRRQGETPLQYLQRVREFAPDAAEWLAELTELYTRCQYRSDGDEQALQDLRRLQRGKIKSLSLRP